MYNKDKDNYYIYFYNISDYKSNYYIDTNKGDYEKLCNDYYKNKDLKSFVCLSNLKVNTYKGHYLFYNNQQDIPEKCNLLINKIKNMIGKDEKGRYSLFGKPKEDDDINLYYYTQDNKNANNNNSSSQGKNSDNPSNSRGYPQNSRGYSPIKREDNNISLNNSNYPPSQGKWPWN